MTVRRKLLAIVFLAGAWLRADSIPVDPDMSLDTGIGESPAVHGLTFSFNANANGGGTFQFENVSGEDWFRIDIYTPLFGNVGDYSCFANEFQCAVGQLGSTLVISYFGAILPHAGQQQPNSSGAHFTISLDPVISGHGFWQPNQHFEGAANFATPIPEPGSLVILLSSCGLLSYQLLRRGRRRAV